MFNIEPLEEKDLLHHVSRFSEAVARVLFDLCGIPFLAGVPLKSNSNEVTLQELTLFTYFTGTVQGTYTITIPLTVAAQLLEIEYEENLTIDDYATGLFEEVINVAVGQSIEELKSLFGFLTFNPPVIALGELRFPSYRNCSVDLVSDIGSLSAHFSVNMANLEITDKLLSTMKHLRKQQSMNFMDSLTGVYNRSYLEYYKSKLFGKRRPLSFIIIDVDKFKDINDNFGHSSGDLALKHISSKISNNVRDNDIAIRYGGDEFVIILEDSPLIGARKLSSRIAKSLKDDVLVLDEDNHLTITLSIGITEYVLNESFEDLFKRADANLYDAKEQGRDKICG